MTKIKSNRHTSHFLRYLIFCFYIREIGKAYKVNSSVIFKGKPKEAEEFLIQIVEALSFIIDKRPKEKISYKVITVLKEI